MKRRTTGGFTLLELIVVITIIGILGTFVVMNVAGSTTQARQTKAKNDVKMIYSAAQAYEAVTGNWPESVEELINARHPDTNVQIPGTLKEYPKDPWGNDYLYEPGEFGPVVICYGKDNSPGGEGENMDFQYPVDEGF